MALLMGAVTAVIAQLLNGRANPGARGSSGGLTAWTWDLRPQIPGISCAITALLMCSFSPSSPRRAPQLRDFHPQLQPVR